MATKSGEMREMLLSIIEDIKSRKIDDVEAGAIAKVAAQINNSLKIEVDARIHDERMRQVKLGSMPLGEED